MPQTGEGRLADRVPIGEAGAALGGGKSHVFACVSLFERGTRCFQEWDSQGSARKDLVTVWQ
jgi:hypothetical protein